MSKYIYFIFIFLLSVSTFSQVDTSITAKITFDKNSALNEISGKPVKLVNALHVSDRFGNTGNAAYTHGGLGSYINLGTGPELKPQHGSISLWFKIEIVVYSGRGNNVNPIIVAKNGIPDSTGKNEDFCEAYAMCYDLKVHKLGAASTQSEKLQSTLHTRDTVNLYEWHHAVLTYDSIEMKLYMDGVLDSQMPKQYKTLFSAADSVLIANTGSKKNERFFCGSIDDITIYNRVISPQEVVELYNSHDPNEFSYYMRWIKLILTIIGCLALITWLVLRKMRSDIKRQEEKNRVTARMNELETRAIRTQMNPHFMFNALNTLQRFILEEDIANANSYLVKFSSLLRKLLESSTSEKISLKEEIEILSVYVEIEKLRFDKSFEFELYNTIPEPEKIFVPFMLIQPFVENAIWHGLLPKKGNRTLVVAFSTVTDKIILCRITDNGVGRQHSLKQKDPFRKKSMAIEFIKQRLEILEKVTNTKCSFQIIDHVNSASESEGTTVEIYIPILK